LTPQLFSSQPFNEEAVKQRPSGLSNNLDLQLCPFFSIEEYLMDLPQGQPMEHLDAFSIKSCYQ
jgi:hypothetical protein